jgi:CRP-like cAMP-binding protein
MKAAVTLEQLAQLKRYFAQFLSIPPLEWLHFTTRLKFRTLKKGEFFLRQGQPVSDLGFVLKGLLFNFYTNQDGEQFVKYFIPEGNIVGCYSSLIRNRHAVFSCQTLEPTALLTMKYADVQSLFDRHACWEKLGRLSAERLYIDLEEREQYFLMSDAKTRYEGFIKDRPGLEQRIPQYIIASYIGISPVSLSRLRRK